MNSMKIGTYQMDTTFGLYLPEYTIPAPAVQTNFVKIIGRDGSVDLSNALGLHYDSRTWSLDFKCFDPTVNWHTLSSQVMNAIHGKRLNFEFDDDPNYFWTGRVSVQNYVSSHGTGTLKVTIVSDPFKYAKLSTIVTKTASTGTDYTGSMVTFNDGLIYDLSADIEPIQDLHGYDSPWPAGGGKNLYNSAELNTYSSYGITATEQNGKIVLNGTATQNAYFTCTVNLPTWNYVFSLNNPVANSGVRCAIQMQDQSYFVDSDLSVTNKVLTLTNKNIWKAIIYVKAGTIVTNFEIKPQIETGTIATAWSPYSNICPISGRTGLSVYRTGKNLLHTTGTTQTRAQVEYTVNADGTVKVNGMANGIDPYTVGYLDLKGGTSYTLSSGATNSNSFYLQVIGDGISGINTASGAVTFTPPSDMTGTVRIVVTNGTNVNNVTIKPMVCLSTATDPTTFAPYTGNTYALDWTTEAGTVYGGTLDVVTGVLTVDKKYFTQSGDVLLYGNWGYDNAPLYYIDIDNTIPIKVYADTQDDGYILSNYFSATTGSNPESMKNNEIRTKDNTPYRLYFRWDSAGSLADINAAFAENPLQIVAELATPLTYQLSAQEVEALVGTNNVWSDGGNVTVAVVTPETLTNNGRAVVPTLTASADMVLKWGNYSASVQQGTSTIPQLILENGANLVYIIGTGSISFTWQEVRL